MKKAYLLVGLVAVVALVYLLIPPTPSKTTPPPIITPSTIASTITQSAAPTTPMQVINSPKNTMPPIQIDPEKTYLAVLKTTLGDITIELTAKLTPLTVNNFVALARQGFYTNTIFHRVIKGFMIQGGDPKGDGTGGPGYKFADEPFTGDYLRGTVAMANSGPNTNGSQFFIMHQATPLQKDYVIFGQVIAGLDVVDTIADSPVEAGGMGEASKPITPTKILSVTIEEK